jgi:hypothetical protein
MSILLKPLLKYGLIALAIIGVLSGMYLWGRSNGHDSGYQEAWAAQQKTIQAMVDKENAQATAQNNKIDKVEQQSQTSAAADETAVQQQVVTVTKVVTKYVHDNPTTANNCGWDAGAVAAINSIVSNDTQTTAGVKNESPHKVVMSRPVRRPHLLASVRMREHTASRAHAIAYRPATTEGGGRSTLVSQVSGPAKASGRSLQSETVFEYHSDLLKPVPYVPTPSIIIVGPDLGRLQPSTSGSTRSAADADSGQYTGELPVSELRAA